MLEETQTPSTPPAKREAQYSTSSSYQQQEQDQEKQTTTKKQKLIVGEIPEHKKYNDNEKKDKKDNRRSSEINDKTKTEIAGETFKRVKKRKYALVFGYSGEGYYGLQRNATIKSGEFRTIEDEIVDSLVKLDYIPQDHADEMFKMSFQRAARTDKGVSAAENLISLKMNEIDEENKETPPFLDKLNALLPEQIKCFGYNKVTQSFCCKNACDGRTYTYMLPTFAFAPVDDPRGPMTEKWRAQPEDIERVRKCLKTMCGTHNFHNFTSGKKFTDPSANRYIIDFDCSEPFEQDGYEFCVIKVRGQSFMLNQIRKMVGMCIAVVRGLANQNSLEQCYTAYKCDVPIAPALGLMLDKLHYDSYNKKFGQDGVHKPIEWEGENGELRKEIDQHTHKHIFSRMIHKEIEEKSMFVWLSRLPMSHLGYCDPNSTRGGYDTGIGRAYLVVEEDKKKETARNRKSGRNSQC